MVIHPITPPPARRRSPARADWFTAVLAGATRALTDLRKIRAVIDANAPAGKNLGLAVTEYGIWPYASQDPRDFSNLAGALYDADLLMGLSREAGGLDLILAAAWNLHGSNPTAAIGYNWDLGTRTVRPQYQVLKILRQLSGWNCWTPRCRAHLYRAGGGQPQRHPTGTAPGGAGRHLQRPAAPHPAGHQPLLNRPRYGHHPAPGVYAAARGPGRYPVGSPPETITK